MRHVFVSAVKERNARHHSASRPQELDLNMKRGIHVYGPGVLTTQAWQTHLDTVVPKLPPLPPLYSFLRGGWVSAMACRSFSGEEKFFLLSQNGHKMHLKEMTRRIEERCRGQGWESETPWASAGTVDVASSVHSKNVLAWERAGGAFGAVCQKI